MKNVFKFLFISLLALSFSSCDLGGDKALDFGSGAFLTQFTTADKLAFFNKDLGTVYTYDIPITLVGGNGLALNSDTSIVYEVDPTSTAVLGTNFDFVIPGFKATIPAGKTFTSVQIKVYSATLNDQMPPKVILKMKSATSAGGQNVLVTGGIFKTTVTLQAQCSSDLAGNYSLVTTRLGTGATYPFAVEPVVATNNAAEYLTNTTGPYFPTPGTGSIPTAQIPPSNAGFTFNDVCGRLKLKPNQTLASYYSNAVSQSDAEYATSVISTVNVGGVPKKVMTIYYSVNFASGLRGYKAVYTKI